MSEKFKLCVAVHVFFLRGDEVLLLRRANTGYEDGNYGVVAGHLDGDETVLEAAAREALEEAGVTPTDLRIASVMHRKSNDERVDFFLTASDWLGDIVNTEPDKCDDLRWFPADALPENTIPYIRRALQNVLAERPFDLYGWANRGEVHV